MVENGTASTGRRITLVADELRGIQGGGLGTVFAFLAIALARLGHTVEILYFGHAAQPVDPEWAKAYERWGVIVRRLPPGDARVEPSYFRRLFEIDAALSASPPDVVIAQDLAGAAYVPLRRRQLGLGFDETLFIVRCSGTRRWITDAARKVRVLPGALAVTVLEQAALELADVVIAESRYMVEWMREQGWQLPPETHVIPSIMEAGATGETSTRAPLDSGSRVRRLAFFGRLEERKGVRPFVAALNALEPDLLEGVELEFVGASTPAWPPERVRGLLSPRTAHALGDVRFVAGLDRRPALAHLAESGTLAVMPSLEDNSPSTVYECLELGIPFIASAVGGTAELVADSDRARILFEPTPTGIAGALRAALSTRLRPARAAFDDAESLRAWQRLVAMRPPRRSATLKRPAVHVIVTQRTEDDDISPLREALTRNGYDNFALHVVTADDGGARFAAALTATAPWVLFLDARDSPSDGFLSTLVQAQAATGADVVTCGVSVADERGESTSYVFLGEPGALGVLSNSYGTVALIRRSLFENELEIASSATSDPDWPLLAQLSAAGASIVSIPFPLVSRKHRPGDVRAAPSDALLVVAALERSLQNASQSLARLAAGLEASATTARSNSPQRRLRWLAQRALGLRATRRRRHRRLRK